jgi:cytochrome c nitrite reductase small subunit
LHGAGRIGNLDSLVEISGSPMQHAAQSDRSTRKPGRGRALLALAIMAGGLAGLGAFTFHYGEGTAYLRNDPKGCANCHVMQGHYDAWQASSHRHVATCNDCHLPHNFVGKWVTKGDNGFFHSLAFTTGDFHEPIQIKARNRRVTQGACLHCHGDLVNHMLPAEPGGDMVLCIQCHADVGHAHR